MTFKRVNIEISNICNLQCSFCPPVEREGQVMSQDLFKSILQQVGPLTQEVCLHLMGEPLGHPELGAFLDLCTEAKVPVNLTTNGTLLDDLRRNLLLSPIVRQVNVSLHSFEANFGEQDVSAYLKKVFAFTHQALAKRPDLYINYRIWDLADPVSLTATSLRIRDAIEQEFNYRLDADRIDVRRQKGYRITGRLYFNFDSRFEWPSLKTPIRSESGFCHGLSNHFGIHADGTVVPCCLDKEATLTLGRITPSETLAQILAGPRARSMAEGFKAGRCVEELCKRCDFIKRFD